MTVFTCLCVLCVLPSALRISRLFLIDRDDQNLKRVPIHIRAGAPGA